MSVVNPGPVVYPASDGKRMSDNPKQARWIFILYGNLRSLYRERRHEVFVAADHLWYPVEGEPTVRTAPDVYVVLGRPDSDRPSYLQWEEADVPVTVAFEVLSPSNTSTEMDDKLQFYDEYGVQEYYLYDPDKDRLRAWVRGRATLAERRVAGGFTSPLMGIRFDTTVHEMQVFHPNGERFLTFEELKALQEQGQRRVDEEHRLRVAAEQVAAAALAEHAAAVHRATLSDLAAAAAQQQATAAHLTAAAAQQQAHAAHQETAEARRQAADAERAIEAAQQQAAAAERAARDVAQREQAGLARARRLRDLGRLARAGQATPDELAELSRLEDELDAEP